MNELINEIEKANDAPQKGDLSAVRRLAEDLLDLYDQKGILEAKLAALTGMIRTIETETLPEKMTEAGSNASEITFKDLDSKLMVKPWVNASPKDKQAVHQWLIEHGYDGLIKTETKLTFGKGEHSKAAKVAIQLVELGYEPETKETVHPMTLQAFVRDQLEQGEDLPDFFGVATGVSVKLKKLEK